jgi:hypothetical protein
MNEALKTGIAKGTAPPLDREQGGVMQVRCVGVESCVGPGQPPVFAIQCMVSKRVMTAGDPSIDIQIHGREI